MSRSEFRYNKKRKHYAYLHKDKGLIKVNFLITSKPHVTKKKNGRKKIIMQNITLTRHPNPKKEGTYYIIPKNYYDHIDSFSEETYSWNWSRNDKRNVKRIKKKK